MNMQIDLGRGLMLRNPILTASGTFGYGVEYMDFLDLNDLGGFVVKGTTLERREGNPYPRMAETPSGMLNAVGLQNPGVDFFIEHIYPTLQAFRSAPIVNVSGSTIEQYQETARRLAALEGIPAIELNISCPNVKEGGMGFGQHPEQAAKVVQAVREVYPKHLMVKLSPNVTDIVSIALAVEQAGADSISLINTLLGMAIDAESRRPMLSTITGGLSGPAVKPIALRMVWQVTRQVRVPVVGMGGITCVQDVVEFLLAGASAVQVGCYNFVDPSVSGKLPKQLQEWMQAHDIHDVHSLIGGLLVE